MSRKPKPARIYREEVTHLDDSPGSTRQTFDAKQYANWRAYDLRYRQVEPVTSTAHYFEGNIVWREA